MTSCPNYIICMGFSSSVEMAHAERHAVVTIWWSIHNARSPLLHKSKATAACSHILGEAWAWLEGPSPDVEDRTVTNERGERIVAVCQGLPEKVTRVGVAFRHVDLMKPHQTA
jgi:hypothetical protein